MNKKNSLFKSASLMMIIMLIGKVLGLYRDILDANVFGTNSIEGTAFGYASTFPRTFLDIMFASAITGGFIPIFNAYMEKKSMKEAYRLASNFISIIFVISSIFTVVCIIFSPFIIQIMAGNNIPIEVRDLAIPLLRMMFPLIIISSVAFSITGILQSMDEFIIPAAMSVVSNLVIIFYYLFLIDDFGVYGLAIFYLIGWLTQIVIQVPFLIRNDFKFKFKIDLKDEGIREIFKLILPVMVSTWVLPVNLLVNTRNSSYVGIYGPNAIRYANTLYMVITGVFITSIGNVIFPTLSKLGSKNDNENFASILKSTISVLFFLLIPMTFGLIAISEPLVRFLYEGGNFDATSTYYTSMALKGFSVGIIGYGLQIVLCRAYYAVKNGKIPAIASGISIVINITLGYVLVRSIDILGPPIASSLSLIIGSLFMLLILYKNNAYILDKKLIINIVKICVSSVIMYVIVFYVNKFTLTLNIPFVDLVTLIVSVGIGGLAYLVCIYVLKVDEVDFIKGLLNKVLKRGAKNE